MLMKTGYLLAAGASLLLMTFEAPRGALLTSSPDKGKVQRQTATGAGAVKSMGTVRALPFIFIGGIHGGK